MSNPAYVILCSGQSNMARITPDIPWSPPTNLQVWLYSAHRHGSDVGDGFAAPSPNIGNYANFYGAQIARKYPEREIYIINISKGGTNLCQWFESAEPINMWTAIKGNVEAAFYQISDKTHIDEIIWWGHESDAAETADVSATQFRDDFLNIIQNIDTQDWVSENKPPIRLHKIHPKCNGLADQINFGLELIVQQNSNRFSLSDTTNLNYSDNIHLDPDQKELAANQVIDSPPINVDNLYRPNQPNLLNNGDFSSYENDHPDVTSPTTLANWSKNNSNTHCNVIDQVVHLKAGGSLKQSISSHNIANQVVTISMENVFEDVVVQIENQKATVTAGTGRRQASIRLRKTTKQSLVLSITTSDRNDAKFSKVKLEIGGSYTDFSSKSGTTEPSSALLNGRRLIGF